VPAPVDEGLAVLEAVLDPVVMEGSFRSATSRPVEIRPRSSTHTILELS